MKNYKKILAPIMASAVILSCMSFSAITASAADPYTITIEHPTVGESTEHNHVFEAYQIFKGDLAANGVLSNIVWGSGVNGTDLLAALKKETKYASCTSAADVASVLVNYKNNDDALFHFSKIVAKYLTAVKEVSASTSSTADATIKVGEAGYYLIKDDPDVLSSNTFAETAYILQVVQKDTKVTAKTDVPTIDKHINETGKGLVSANTASIGDKINYQLDSAVPNVYGYTKYFYIVTDTMSKGLTFNDDIVVKVGGKELVKDTDYRTESAVDNDTEETTIKIKFIDILEYNDPKKNVPILITYSATLNQDADLTQTGNPNTVVLNYSNNPNHEYTGDPDKPGEPGDDDKDFMGESAEVTVKTYSTAIKLTKVNGQDNTLTGAKFSISGTKLNYALLNGEIYQKDANGTYYMLKDGTYTETAPTDLSEEAQKKYDSLTEKYTKVDVINQTTAADKTKFNATAYVDENGVLTFEGLGAGEYEIQELVAPAGYNLLTDPITVDIKTGTPLTVEQCKWTVTVNKTSVKLVDDVIPVKFVNEAGAQLPSTGGIGTTLFYIVGSMMMAGAVVLFVMRRKAEKN